MADNEQQMVLVAKLVDQVSDKLKEINKAMLATASAASKSHKSAGDSADKHRQAIERLHKSFEKIKDTAVDVVMPGFAALGIEAFSIAAAINAVTGAVKGLGETGLALQKVSNRTGMAADQIRQIQGLGERWGVSLDQTNESLSQFGDMMARSNRLAPDAIRQWQQMPGLFEMLGTKLIGIKDPKEQFDRTMDFIVRMPLQDQRRRALAILGLPQDLANFTKETLEEARREEETYTRNHPFAKDIAAKADENFTKINRALRGFKDDMGAAFGGPVLHGLEELNKLLEKPEAVETINDVFKRLSKSLETDIKDVTDLIDLLKSLVHWAPAEWMKKTPAEAFDALKQRLAPPGSVERATPNVFNNWSDAQKLGAGMRPISYTDGFQDRQASSYVEQTMYRAMFQALQDWWRSIHDARSGGSNGFQNASFGGSSGAASGGGIAQDGGDVGGGDAAGDRAGVGGGSGAGGRHGGGGKGGGDMPVPDTSDVDLGKGAGEGSGKGPLGKSQWFDQLEKNPALKESLFRHSLGENDNPMANKAVMEEARNRADIRNAIHGTHNFGA